MTRAGDKAVGEMKPVAASYAAVMQRVEQQPVCVILGVQGSGTNLLRRILTSAFNASVVQDQALVIKAGLRLGTRPSQDAVRQEFQTLLARMVPSAVSRKTQRLVKTNGSFEGIERHFDPAAIGAGADFARFIYAYSAFSRDTTFMAIKSDDLWASIADIDHVLPNRRIVLLTRDFRDNLLSITRKPFGPVEPLIAARYVKERFGYYDREYRLTPDAQRLHVRFEDMLERPESVVGQFRDRFDLGEPSPLNMQRIRSDNKRKWGVLTPQQLAYCEAILRDELETYGYGTETHATALPNAATWRKVAASDAVKRVPQKLRALTRRLGK